jgi:chain length determinant protein tyrosine kinase EpsG
MASADVPAWSTRRNAWSPYNAVSPHPAEALDLKFSRQEIEADYAPGRERASERPIGELMRVSCALTDEEIERIAAYKRRSGLRFGEAAVALRLAQREDVLAALSQQFQYPVGFLARHEISAELIAAANPFSEQAEAFRELRTRLLEAMDDAPHPVLAVVSADSGDGKTYLAANLAVAFSQLGERTLLIDADIRTPRQHTLLGVENGVGFTSVLAGFSEVAAAIQVSAVSPELYLLPAGAVPPNPLELLQRRQFRALMREVQGGFAHVVIDTPAAVRGADCRVIAARCGAALVVGRRGRSRLAPLEGLLDALDRARVKLAGVVMNEH